MLRNSHSVFSDIFSSFGAWIRAEQGNQGAASCWIQQVYFMLLVCHSLLCKPSFCAFVFFLSIFLNSFSVIRLSLAGAESFPWESLAWEQLCLKGSGSTSKRESYLEQGVGLTVCIYDDYKLMFSNTFVKQFLGA